MAAPESFRRKTHLWWPIMGFEVDLYGKHASEEDHKLNGACIYLTVPPNGSGLSPYACGKPEPTGTFYAVPREHGERHLTCDRLWGMRLVILEVLLRQDPGAELKADLLKGCKAFCEGRWMPVDGNPQNINFYGNSPGASIAGTTTLLSGPSKSSSAKLSRDKFQREAVAWARDHVTRMKDTCNDEDTCDLKCEHEVVSTFIKEHMANFPSEDSVKRYLANKLPQYAGPYHHNELQGIFEAGALSFEEEERQVRMIRQLGLNNLGGIQAMRVAYYAVNHSLCAKEFWGTDVQEGEFHILGSWNRFFGILWDGIGEWKE